VICQSVGDMSSFKEQADFHAKFDFFTRTPARQQLPMWVSTYLRKKGIFVAEVTMKNIKLTLFTQFKDLNERITFDFFRKMEKAWDAHNRRQASNNSMLNVSISKSHKSMFLRMAKDAKCTNIQMLEALIDDNYKNFISSKDEERFAKDAKKAKKDKTKENQSFTNSKLNGEILRLKNNNSGFKSQISKLRAELQPVKDNSTILFAMIAEAVKNSSKLTIDNLVEATIAHTLIGSVQLPLEEPIEAPVSEANTEHSQISDPSFRKRARSAKTAIK
jgi:hypothetical protein